MNIEDRVIDMWIITFKKYIRAIQRYGIEERVK